MPSVPNNLRAMILPSSLPISEQAEQQVGSMTGWLDLSRRSLAELKCNSNYATSRLCRVAPAKAESRSWNPADNNRRMASMVGSSGRASSLVNPPACVRLSTVDNGSSGLLRPPPRCAKARHPSLRKESDRTPNAGACPWFWRLNRSVARYRGAVAVQYLINHFGLAAKPGRFVMVVGGAKCCRLGA